MEPERSLASSAPGRHRQPSQEAAHSAIPGRSTTCTKALAGHQPGRDGRSVRKPSDLRMIRTPITRKRDCLRRVHLFMSGSRNTANREPLPILKLFGCGFPCGKLPQGTDPGGQPAKRREVLMIRFLASVLSVRRVSQRRTSFPDGQFRWGGRLIFEPTLGCSVAGTRCRDATRSGPLHGGISCDRCVLLEQKNLVRAKFHAARPP
jgi:hypothetical protein